MKELQFIRSLGQGNIYSTTRFGNLTLTATGSCGRVLAHVNLTTLLELLLSSIPVGSDIIAIDACQDEHYIIGVTFIQTTQIGIEEVRTPYLNFYAAWASKIEAQQEDSGPRASSSSRGSESGTVSRLRGASLSKDNLSLRLLETIGQKCVQFKLNFTPYHLSHTRVQNPTTGSYETLFILTGSDCRIHSYKPTTETESFTQVPIQTHFPELYGIFPSVVTRVRIVKLDDPNKRLSLCGCEDGHLRSFIVSNPDIPRIPNPSPVLYYWKKPVADDRIDEDDEKCSDEEKPKRRFFSAGARGSIDTMLYYNCDVDLGPFVERVITTFDSMITAVEPYWTGSVLNVVVSSANSPVFLFTDPASNSFVEGFCLKFSSRWDAVQVICVADIDGDGELEVILGTFGCILLVYKFMEEIGQWVIVVFHKFPSAIFALDFKSHLSVITGSGLHVMECCVEDGTQSVAHHIHS